mmetsp:Transcript_51469/g.61920  ORF Transcript_51469/g.61920 Transcript_51469/m.61920 type:complete len:84 (+) Transcript_51469:416-667(+)
MRPGNTMQYNTTTRCTSNTVGYDIDMHGSTNQYSARNMTTIQRRNEIKCTRVETERKKSRRTVQRRRVNASHQDDLFVRETKL